MKYYYKLVHCLRQKLFQEFDQGGGIIPSGLKRHICTLYKQEF